MDDVIFGSKYQDHRVTKGFKFKNLAPVHAPFGNILSSMRWDLSRAIHVPNLKFLASPVPKIWHRCH